MSEDKEFKTLGAFRFDDDLWLGFQYWQNQWGSSLHRIVQLLPDLKTVVSVGNGELYLHPSFFEYQSRTFIAVTQYYEDDHLKPEIVYELLPPPDSDMALESVEKRAQKLMRRCSKTELGQILRLDSVMDETKQELAQRVIRLRDEIERLCR